METGPILRALFKNKGRFWLIAIEIALTLAVVVNCMNMIQDQRKVLVRPTGIDEDQLLVVRSEPFAAAFQDEDYARVSFEEDLQAIRALPGVEHVSSTHQVPLSGAGSATGRRAEGSEGDTMTMPYFIVAPDLLETLGVELVAGRNFSPVDFHVDDDDEDEPLPTPENPSVHNIIVTQAMADRFFPEGDAVGKTIENRTGNARETVIGVIDEMHGSWIQSSVYNRVALFAGEPWSRRRARFLVRVEPGMLDELYASLESELLRVNDGRIITVRTMDEVKRSSVGEIMAVNKMLGFVSLLLVAVTCLGIVGLTSFSVTQRTKQIGTRRALGATRWAILRYFLVENWILTGVGLLLGLLFTYGLSFALAKFANMSTLEWPIVLTGMIALWLAGLLAALVPALRGAWVSPVVATRTV